MKNYITKQQDTSKVNEPAIAYSMPFKSILYNYDSPAISDKNMMDLARNGLSRTSFKELAVYLDLTQESLSGLLHTSFRNIQRKADNEPFDSLKSQQLMELAAFARRATQVLGSRETMISWLHSPLPALNFETPFSMLDNTFGLKILYKVLGRLEHGVYS